MLRTMCKLTVSIAILYQLTCRTCFEVVAALFTLATIGARDNIISGHDWVLGEGGVDG